MGFSLRRWARTVKRDVHTVYLCARDPRTPWYAKALAFVVAGYALSPIDLIPDFIPVLGYLDDIILVPLGILAVRRLIPPHVLAENREIAARAAEKPVSRIAMAVIIAIWVAVLAGVAVYAAARFAAPADQRQQGPVHRTAQTKTAVLGTAVRRFCSGSSGLAKRLAQG